MRSKTALLTVLLALSIATAARAEDFSARIYEPGREAPIYNLKRAETRDGKNLVVKTRFTHPKGEAVVEEELVLEDGRIRKYELKRLAENELGTLEVKGGKIEFTYRKEGKLKHSDEDLPDNLIVAPTLVDHLQKNWATLMKGDDVDVRYAALDRLETVGFKFFKVGESAANGRKTVDVKMKPTSFIIAAIVKPLVFTFDRENQRLLSFKGRQIPKQLKNGKWDDLDGLATYTYP